MTTRPRSDVAVIGLRGFPNVIGGIEAHAEHLYTTLAQMPDAPRTAVFMRRTYPGNREDIANLRIRHIWTFPLFGVETGVYSLLSLIVARLWMGIKIIHFHSIGPAILVPLARLLGATVVVTHHAADYDRPKWSRLGKLTLRAGEFMTARLAHRVVCVSEALSNHFLGLYPKARSRTSVILHGLPRLERDLSVLDALNLDRQGYILAVGRFDRTKRFEDVIAANHLADTGLPVVIAGRSAGEQDYDDELADYAGPSVILAGFCRREQLAALYANAAVFVHASEMEGCGLVVIEALMEGAPVLVSDIPPMREFALAEDHYFPVGDVETLAAKLAGAFEAETAATRIAFAQRYDFDAMVESYLALYRSLMPARIARQ